MLRVVLNIKQNKTFPTSVCTVGYREKILNSHCLRHRKLPASELVLWEPTHRHRSIGHPSTSYMDVLKTCVGVESTNMLTKCMERSDMTEGLSEDNIESHIPPVYTT